MCLYLNTSRLGIDGYELEYLLSAKNLIASGSLYLSPEPNGVPGVMDRLNGQPLLPRHNLLQVFLALPFYIAGIPFNSLIPPQNTGVMALPAGSLISISLINPLLTLLGAFLVYRICRQVNQRTRTSELCAGIYAVATMAWPYSAIGMEPLQTASLLGSITCLLSLKHTINLKNTLMVSLILLCLMHTKISAPALALIPAIWVVLIIWHSNHPKRYRYLMIFISVMTVSSWIWFVLYSIRSQSFYASDFFAHFNAALIPRNIVGLIFSPGKGLFFFNLILLWGIPSLLSFPRRQLSLTWIFSGIIAIAFILVACWDWALIEESWGPRYLLPVVPLILIAGAPSFAPETICKHRKSFLLILILSILIQFPGVIYPGVCLLKYCQTEKIEVIDIATWIPELSPIKVGWHMALNQLRHSFGLSPEPLTWRYYSGIIGWGASASEIKLLNPHWNRPIPAPFLLTRFCQSKPGNRSFEYPDPPWLFPVWLSSIIALIGWIIIRCYKRSFNSMPYKETINE